MKRNTHKNNRRAILAATLAVGLLPIAARAVTYTAANTFDLNPPGYPNSYALGISGTLVVGYYNYNNDPYALLWSGTAASSTALSPPGGFTESLALGISGNNVVGWGEGSGAEPCALLWTAAGVYNLNPSGFNWSIANGIGGNQEVGYGQTFSGQDIALLWTGSSPNATNLNPTGFISSAAFATNGTQQVGWGSNGGYDVALLWTGTAASAVNLNPAGFTVSNADGISGTQQVGYGTVAAGGNFHALLWSGSAASYVDLNPTGFTASWAAATNGTEQVGGGQVGTTDYALLWSGTAASAVNLNNLLPGATSSIANSIDAYGNIAGYANVGGQQIAVEWLAGNTYNVSNVADGTSGDWGTSANWTAGTPVAGNDVLLIQEDAANRTITYSSAATAWPLGNITVDATGGGSMTVQQTGGTLNSTDEYIGFIGAGTFTQSGGTHSISGSLILATQPGSQGTYNLSGGVLNVGTVQLNAGGTFNQTGGTLAATTFYQQGGTVTGTLTNQGTFDYFSGTFSGQLVNQGSVALYAPFTAGNGIVNYTTLTIPASEPVTVNGSGLTNYGSVTLSGGVLGGSGNVSNYGTFNAYGTITPSFQNYGQVSLYSGNNLQANGGLTNNGTINLNGGNISGSGIVSNGPGGLIQGSGNISAALTNSGGVIQAGANTTIVLTNLQDQGYWDWPNWIVTSYANSGGMVVAPTGQIVAVSSFTNSGYIQLLGAGATFSGGAITNYGTVEGAGQVGNSIDNNGAIIAENGELRLNGSVSNESGGQIQAATGNTVFVTGGLSTISSSNNYGTIALSGGTFDNNNQPLTNDGTISGNGTIRTGGLTNQPDGIIILTDANSSVYGPVTNNGNIVIVGNTTTFYGNVNNTSGTFTVTSGVARFLGNGVSMTVGGTYTSDPSANYFHGLATTSTGTVTGGSGDQFFMTGGTVLTNAGTWNNGGTLSANAISNSGTFIQTGALTASGTFTNSGNVTIGGTLSAATISQLAGAFIETGTLTLAGSGGNAVTFNLSGGTLATGSLSVASGGTLNWTAGTLDLTNSSLTIGSGGPLGSALTLAAGRNLIVADTLTNNGSVTIDGGSLTAYSLAGNAIVFQSGVLNVTGPVSIGSGGSAGSTVTISANQTFGSSSGTTVTSSGSLNVAGGTVTGGLSNGGNLAISGTSAFTGAVTTTGNISVTSGNVTFAQGLTITSGSMTTDPSTLALAGLSIAAGATVTGSTGDQYIVTGGNVVTNAGTFTDPGSLSAATVSNSGTLAVTGGLTETGNFTNSGTATIGGTQNWSPGTTYSNSAGVTTFQSDTGSSTSSPLALSISGGSIIAAADQHINGLSITAGALDVTTHTVTLNSASTSLATVQSYVASGYDNGKWDGSGIISSDADAAHGVGYMDNGNGTITVRYTLYGDATCDGLVNYSDLLTLAQHYDTTGNTWSTGDFNYDPAGAVGFADLVLMARNYGQSLTSAEESQVTPNFAAAWAAALADAAPVPEPASLGLLALGATGLLARRRRRL